MEDSTTPAANGGIRSTSVSITLNGKSLGVDAFVKLEQTHEFVELADDFAGCAKRVEIAALLTEQALDIIKETAAQATKFAAENPRGHVSVHQVQPQAAPAGAFQGQTVAGTGPAAVAAVANGAGFQSDWREAPDRFDAAKRVRFLSSTAYPTDRLKAEIGRWLEGQGFNPSAFDIWDERTGPRGAEAGAAISSVANVKIAEPFRSSVPHDVAFAGNGVRTVARVKFNNDGSLYCYWAKEAEAAGKYGALDALKGGVPSAAVTESDPF